MRFNYRKLEEIFSRPWFRVIESLIVLYIMFYIFSSILGYGYDLACILIPSIFLMVYVETLFKTPWPRILLPFSLGNSTLLASIMFHGTVPEYVYRWIIIGYALAIFALFHALTRMYSLFLKERSSRYRIILEGVLIDVLIFIVISGILVSILILYRAIMIPYGVLLILAEGLVLILVPWITINFIIPGLFERRIHVMGYTHPREPEIEEFYFELSSVTVMFILIIPAVIAYTSTTLTRRAFIPMALLGVYETIIMAYYTITFLVGVHGAFIESLLGDRIVGIEYGDVVRKWRDIAWFINTSIIYYSRMKYLSALFMLFQGLELLSIRTGDRELYFGSLYNLLVEGYEKIKNDKLLSKHVLWKHVEEALNSLKPENMYVLEPNWKPLEKTGLEEELKKALGSIVNIYCKFHELKNVEQDEVKQAIRNAISRLEILKKRVRGHALHVIVEYINGLNSLLAINPVKPGDLEKYLVKQPLTINMLRNYIVHGQLYKNALVYRGSRVRADRVLSKPAVLYAIYTLLITTLFSRHPELLREN